LSADLSGCQRATSPRGRIRPVVASHAQRLGRQKPLLTVWLGLLIVQVGQVLDTYGEAVWFIAVTVVVFVIASGFVARDLNAANLFLAHDPGPADEPVD
jgi:hypothetical protein